MVHAVLTLSVIPVVKLVFFFYVCFIVFACTVALVIVVMPLWINVRRLFWFLGAGARRVIRFLVDAVTESADL